MLINVANPLSTVFWCCSIIGRMWGATNSNPSVGASVLTVLFCGCCLGCMPSEVIMRWGLGFHIICAGSKMQVHSLIILWQVPHMPLVTWYWSSHILHAIDAILPLLYGGGPRTGLVILHVFDTSLLHFGHIMG